MRDKRREHTQILKIDNTHINVSFEELFFDLIFIIVISKISMILVESGDISITSIVGIGALFASLVFSWLFRLIHNNQVHILSNRFNHRVANLTRITYLEILVIVLLIHNFEQLTFKFILSLILTVLIVTILTMSQVRSFLVNYFTDDREKLMDIVKKARDRTVSLINIDYISERFGVIIILFLGEILGTLFTNIESTKMLLLGLVIIIYIFNEVSLFLKMVPETIKQSEDRISLYVNLKRYFILLITVLLIVIISLDYSFHNKHLYDLIIFSALCLYQIITTNIKMKFGFNIKWQNIAYYILISGIASFIIIDSTLVIATILLIPFIQTVVNINEKKYCD